MKEMYLLIQGDEDGNPNRFLDRAELDTLLEEGGPERFLTAIPDDMDANYWDEDTALLLKVEVVVPRPAAVKWKLP